MQTQKLPPIILLIFAVVVPAQDFSSIRDEIDNLAKADEHGQDDAIADLKNSIDTVPLLDRTKMAQQILAFRRADIQNGSSSGASGSTSAVLSPLLPAIFGVSFENGAITRSVSGSTIALQANPAGLFCASGPDSQSAALRDDDVCRTFWKRIGITAAFDTSRGEKSKQLADLQTLDNQFSELTVRVELLNHRKLSRAKFTKVYAGEIKQWEVTAKEFANLFAKSAALPGESQLEEKSDQGLFSLIETSTYKNSGIEKRKRLIESTLREVLNSEPKLLAFANERRRLWSDLLKADDRLQSAVLNALVITAEYSYQRADLATEEISDIVPTGVRPPGVHSIRFIAAKGIGDKKFDVTANASASFFSETRSGMNSVFRDFRTGIEGKFRMPDINDWGSPTLSFAGLYVYLYQQPLGLGLLASKEPEIQDKGHIGLFQAKFEMPTANNAIRIPLSFTYSNRTELIKESSTRGQIGICFNLDSLFDK
jgi:hypothetical protein